ncbi:MAG: general secretion pathway protein GspF [Gammaproteobacteria bacterium]|nr:general secretion pathway protein GspF [Gammaproteobacteria bacterium]
MIRARSMEEYRDLINEAIYDVQDLRASIEYDEEIMGDALVFLDPLEAGIRALNQEIKDGHYQFSNQNLPFMAIVHETPGSLLPFKPLLIRINDTHIHGLEKQ